MLIIQDRKELFLDFLPYDALRFGVPEMVFLLVAFDQHFCDALAKGRENGTLFVRSRQDTQFDHGGQIKVISGKGQ